MIKFLSTVLVLFTIHFEICSPTIIIVGTGPAGIAAATRLLKNNATDILILEAERRIGGRINSIEFGETYVDMGAEWCHGQADNIVYDFINEYNILRHTEDRFHSFYSNGEQVDENLNEQLFNIIEGIYAPDGNKKQHEGISLGEYCINK